MPIVSVNFLAIIVCGILYMVLGSIWYGPLFGKYWTKMTGMDLLDKKAMAEARKKMVPTMVASFICSLVLAYVLRLIIGYAVALTAAEGVYIGFLAWLGFIATILMVNKIYNRRPLQLWAIDSGFWLIVMLIFGAILAAWI